MAARQFLFLQGLAGPYFSQLGRALQIAGHGVHRINFHGGDKLFWHLPGAIDYRGNLDAWPDFLRFTLVDRGITDIALFGDCRPLHQAAIKVARTQGIQVHVFEEGYIRPDFVTVEQGGVNGNSKLSTDPDDYVEAARNLPPVPTFPGVPSSFRRRAWEDIVYNLGALALAPLFPGYCTHRPWPILVEYAGWAWRLIRKPFQRRRFAKALTKLKSGGERYFVFPLQLDCDYQIRVHSGFGGMQPAIEAVLSSFGAYAPADAKLVVKGHPLDNGLTNWEKRVLDAAAVLGISNRVVFIDWADIDPLVRHSEGVVTVNSTTGTLSLLYGVPTIVLGDAVYDVPRITHQSGLDRFWTAPEAPDMDVYDAFRRVLIDRCLIHGGYFSREGLDMLVAGARIRIETSVPDVIPIKRPSVVEFRPRAPKAAASG